MRRLNQAIAALAAAGFGLAAAPAQSAAISEWGFTIDSGFIAYTDTNGGTAGITGSAANARLSAENGIIGLQGGGGFDFSTVGNVYSKLAWGIPASAGGQSSLSVGAATNGRETGSLMTNGGEVATVKVVHNNFPVYAPSLRSATLFDMVNLDPLVPDLPGFDAPALLFAIHFLETDNDGSCEVASPIPCNDIFVIDVAGAGFNPVDKTFNQTFAYGADLYNAKVRVDGVDVLTNAACGAVGVANGCLGFTTVEGLSNEFQVYFEITDKPYETPEPAALGLLGAALALLAWRQHRKGR